MREISIILAIFFISIVFGSRYTVAQDTLTEGERMKKRANIERNIELPSDVDREIYISYLAHFGRNFDFYNIQSSRAKIILQRYFGNTLYYVITNWDIDGDGLKDFFAVELYKGVHRGIKRALIVNEKGEAILYIDTLKGIYTPNYMIIDLKDIGYTREEVNCFSIGFIPYIKGNSRTFGNGNGAFDIQIFDKNLYTVGTGYTDNNSSYRRTDSIMLIKYDNEKRRYLFDPDIPPPSNRKDYLRETLQIFREAKRNGKLFKQPEKLNESDIELALKWWLL